MPTQEALGKRKEFCYPDSSFMLEVPRHHIASTEDWLYLYGAEVGAEYTQNYKSVYLYPLEANIVAVNRHPGGTEGLA